MTRTHALTEGEVWSAILFLHDHMVEEAGARGIAGYQVGMLSVVVADRLEVPLELKDEFSEILDALAKDDLIAVEGDNPQRITLQLAGNDRIHGLFRLVVKSGVAAAYSPQWFRFDGKFDYTRHAAVVWEPKHDEVSFHYYEQQHTEAHYADVRNDTHSIYFEDRDVAKALARALTRCFGLTANVVAEVLQGYLMVLGEKDAEMEIEEDGKQVACVMPAERFRHFWISEGSNFLVDVLSNDPRVWGEIRQFDPGLQALVRGMRDHDRLQAGEVTLDELVQELAADPPLQHTTGNEED